MRGVQMLTGNSKTATWEIIQRKTWKQVHDVDMTVCQALRILCDEAPAGGGQMKENPCLR